MTTDLTPVAPEHAAPPPYRPLSAGAVSALALSVFLAIPALLGAWWLEFLPLLVAALSWAAVADGRRRGAGIAIAGCVLALLVGAVSYFGARGIVRAVEDHAGQFLTALSKDDRGELRRWAIEGQEADALVEQWRGAYAAVEREAGPYTGPPRTRWGLLGPYADLLRPPDEAMREIGGTGEPLPGPARAAWFEATFARERVWVALVIGKADATDEDLRNTVQNLVNRGSPALVRQVRFFREP